MWTPEDMGEQRGRVAVVTGANSGLGLETARHLARAGAHVVMAARNQDKAEQARQRIAADVAGAALEVRALDLACLESVRACADGIAADHVRVDLLVNNAGVMALPRQTTAEGFEMQFGVNHLGHFVFTRRLLPAVLRAGAARVVTVSSFARLTGGAIDLGDPHMRGHYDPWRAYGRSKRANLQFALELNRRLAAAGANAISLAANPGLSHTDLQARGVRETGGGFSQRFWHTASRWIGISPDRGAHAQLRAATDPALRGGELVGARWGSFGAPVRRPLLNAARERAAARGLWDVSERETGERFDVAAIG